MYQMHRLFLGSMIGALAVLLLLGFLLYKKDSDVRNYQKQLATVSAEKDSVSSAYAAYKERTRNLRTITVLSRTFDSKNNRIGEIINNASSEVDGEISIYYTDLATGERVVVDGERSYHMASLYKVIVTLYILEAEKEGKISSLDTIGSPAITIDEALTKIITESNNEYAVALAEKYGWSVIEDYINKRFSLKIRFEKDLMANVTDIGVIFTAIAESIELSDAESNAMLELLNKQTRLSKLPKYLPKHIYSHNKTGELEDYSHDAGIFFTPKANYVLVFMSKTPSPGTTNEQMAQMSKKIYDVLNEEN